MTEGQIAILAGYFDAAAKRVGDMVLRPTGRSESSQAFRSGRAAAQAAQIDAILLRLKGLTGAWLSQDNTLLAAVHAARQLADRQAREAGVRVEPAIPGSFDAVDERTAAVFARDAAGDLYAAADGVGERAKRLLRQTGQMGLDEARINAVLAGGAIEGVPALTIRRLREELRAVHGGAVEVNGRNFKVGYYASMVARTKTREATVTARHERLGELGLDLVAIVGRVSDSFCTAFLGQVFSLSGKHPSYPPYASLPGGGPPFHPNCSKSTRPFVEALASGEQKRDARLLEDSRALLGRSATEAQRSYKKALFAA